MNLLRSLAAFAVFAVMVFAASPASARTVSIVHGGTYFGENVTVDRDQVIDGNITVFGGDAIVEGTVNGDVNDYGGSIDQRPGSTISGETHEFGGSYLSALAPWAVGGGASALAAQNARMMERLAYSVIVLLVFLLFPVRVRVALDRLEHHPGLSAAVGTISLVAIIPVAILLAISIIGIPLIPIEIAAILAGIFIGQAALGILIGRRLYELIRPHTTPSPLGALILGLVVVSAAEIVPGVGTFVTMLVVLVGLGAAILAFVREAAFGAPAISRPPISGPPMNPA